jgi:hypothetical protein
MEEIIKTFNRIRDLTDDYEYSTNDKLRDYIEELGPNQPASPKVSPKDKKSGASPSPSPPPVSPNRSPSSTAGKSLHNKSKATSSPSSPKSPQKGPRSPISPSSPTSPSPNASQVSFNPHVHFQSINSLDQGSFNFDQSNSMNNSFYDDSSVKSSENQEVKEEDYKIEPDTTDRFHVKYNFIFNDTTSICKDLILVLAELSQEKVDYTGGPFEIDAQNHLLEFSSSASHERLNTIIDMMKASNNQRLQNLAKSLQSLKTRQKEIIQMSIEKYKQDYNYYRMKNRLLELNNQIAKFNTKLNEMKYELSLKSNEINISVEDLRTKYEQETEVSCVLCLLSRCDVYISFVAFDFCWFCLLLF